MLHAACRCTAWLLNRCAPVHLQTLDFLEAPLLQVYLSITTGYLLNILTSMSSDRVDGHDLFGTHNMSVGLPSGEERRARDTQPL